MAAVRTGDVRPGERRRTHRLRYRLCPVVDFAGVFEAPISLRPGGDRAARKSGLVRRFATEWLLGPREFAAVGGLGIGPASLGLSRILGMERRLGGRNRPRAARIRCGMRCRLQRRRCARHRHRGHDIASIGRVLGTHRSLGGAVSRRHRYGHAGHEHAADFKFTTSRHVIGRRRPLADLIDEQIEAR